ILGLYLGKRIPNLFLFRVHREFHSLGHVNAMAELQGSPVGFFFPFRQSLLFGQNAKFGVRIGLSASKLTNAFLPHWFRRGTRRIAVMILQIAMTERAIGIRHTGQSEIRALVLTVTGGAVIGPVIGPNRLGVVRSIIGWIIDWPSVAGFALERMPALAGVE